MRARTTIAHSVRTDGTGILSGIGQEPWGCSMRARTTIAHSAWMGLGIFGIEFNRQRECTRSQPISNASRAQQVRSHALTLRGCFTAGVFVASNSETNVPVRYVPVSVRSPCQSCHDFCTGVPWRIASRSCSCLRPCLCSDLGSSARFFRQVEALLGKPGRILRRVEHVGRRC